MGTSISPVCFMLPVRANALVPGLVSVPMLRYHARAALDDRRNVCKGLNVIERCRSVEQAVINASGRLGTGHSAPALDGGGQCRTLAADECAAPRFMRSLKFLPEPSMLSPNRP